MKLFALASLALISTMIHAQESSLTKESPEQKAARMKWWKDARFGMFIHWGLYSIPAGKWGNQTGHAEWIRETAQIPVKTYEKFQPQFNPTKFNASEWVKMAKNAGMKYIAITTKHHDGFCLFDSAYTDWDIMGTPFKRDIMKELSDACHKQGITQCWYHSIMDWHHPDYLPRRTWEAKDRPVDGANMDRYVQYLHNQVKELLTKYGPIGVMWFDGEWESTWNHAYGQALYDECRTLQPNVIVNNRVDVGRGGMGGMSDDGYAGDYGTPEQEVPATGLPGVDWESCMTMNNNWGYNAVDLNYKSSLQLIQLLCDIVSKGGNFLLNIGPKADGTFPELAKERLADIGKWMKVNGDSIYGTSASPFKKLAWGRCTQKAHGADTTLYLQVFDWPANGRLVVPGIGNDVVSARLMKAKTNLPTHRTSGDLVIDVPHQAPDSFASVVALEIKGQPIIYEAPEIMADSDVFVNGILVKLSATSPELYVRYTIDGSEPNNASPKYVEALTLTKTATVKARIYHHDKPMSGVSVRTFRRVEATPGTHAPDSVGLNLEYIKGSCDTCADLAKFSSEKESPTTLIGLGSRGKEEDYGLRLTGMIDVESTDVYTFALLSDDGSRLYIDGKLVVDNDGLHSPIEKRGQAALGRGWHSFKLEYFNKSGGSALDLKWARLGTGLGAIDPASLGH